MKRLLTAAKVKNLKPKDKAYKVTDGGGLFVYVSKAGSKSFRYDCSLYGKRFTLTFGTYPEITLADAREQHEQARVLLAKGVDPRQANKPENQLKPFSYYALETNRLLELQPSTLKKRLERQEKHLFPVLDKKPVNEITAIDVLNICKAVAENHSKETAQLLATYTRQTFDTLLSMQLVELNPAESIKRLLPKPKRDNNFTHVTRPEDLTVLLKAFSDYQGEYSVRQALKLMPLVFLRPANIRFLKWEFIDFTEGLITIPADAMKMKRPHQVPLSKQALTILESMKPLTGGCEYVFLTAYGQRTGKAMSENTLNNAIKRAKHPETGEPLGKGFSTSHGLRHTASTMLHEMGFNTDHIEKALAHEEANKVKAAYNKAEYLPERAKMMQAWADYLDTLTHGGNVVPIRSKGV